MDLRYWADTVVFDLNNYGPIAQLDDNDWKGWAAGIIGINGISQQNPPSPYDYDDWREWAYRFYQVLD
jgi:hypothetical protein